jgi:dihydropteroate synthase
MSRGNLAGVEVGSGSPVCIVGALNVSPESFYAGSVVRDDRSLEEAARHMVGEGAAILDIGAMSTAPYLQTQISEDEEMSRLTKAVRVVRAAVSVPLSVDTKRSAVAAAALREGAKIINDVTGLRGDQRMAHVAASAEGVILTAAEHEVGREPSVQNVLRLFRDSLERARRAGIIEAKVVLDPGIGFHRHGAVSWDEVDCVLVRELAQLRAIGRPVMVGISRKSFVGKITGKKDPAERLWGSLAAAAVAVYNGAAMVRTHDVAATRDVVRVAERLRG